MPKINQDNTVSVLGITISKRSVVFVIAFFVSFSFAALRNLI